VDQTLFFFFTLILVSTFWSFAGFDITNGEASTKRYTRVLPYLFVDASLVNEKLLRPFLPVHFNSYRIGSSVAEGSKVSKNYIWNYGF